jgi:tetratricopeptide (TPR) repeat protein
VDWGESGAWRALLAGQLTAARAAFWQEIEAAEAVGDAEALGGAALGLGGIWVHEHPATLEQARVAELQRRALAAIDPDSSLAHRLRIRLAAEHAYISGDLDGVLAELAAARERGVAIELAEALSLTHHCVLGPAHAELRLALADELVGVSPATGRSFDGLLGLMWRTVDLFLAGDRRAPRSLVELRSHLDETPCAALGCVVAALDATTAMRAGRLAEAEELAARCLELGTAVGDADALGWYGAQLLAIRWMQGRAGDLLPMLVELARSPTVAECCSGFDAAVAAAASAVGDIATAATALESLRRGGLASIPASSSWSATLHGAAEAAHALGDVAAAAEVYELLAPFAELPVIVSLGVACFGSTHRPLGLAAMTVGEVDTAIEHFGAAVAADLRLGNLPCVAIDRAAQAGALRRRGVGDDRVRAAELTALAVADARRFGMTGRLAQWSERGPSTGEGAIECRRDGRLWRVRVGGGEAVVADGVGVRYLAELIANPGVEINAVELARRDQPGARHGPAQPVLDDTAKRAYRRQLEELGDELADAEACADLERAARARAALDHYVDALAAATGLGGRERCFPDDAERARVSVQKAIKRALAMIADANPCVGRHLAARVVTGARCVYRPL